MINKISAIRFRPELVFLGLYFIIIGTNVSSGICYAIFGILLFLFLGSRKKVYTRVLTWDFIPLLFLILWAYGVFLGLFYGNKVQYILANNAGMIMYLLYYILLQLRVSKEKIYKLLLYASLTIAIITSLLFFFSLINVPPNILSLLGEFTGGSSTGQRRIYFVSQISLFPALALYMAAFIGSKYQKKEFFQIATSKQRMKVFFAFIIYTMCIVFFTASKGFMLGYIFILFFLPFSLFYKSLSGGRVNKKILFFLILIMILVVLLLSLGYFNIITAIFDNKDDANVLRYEQLYFLLQDLTIMGKGLGAVIPGYARNLDKPYGFELSYLALIHKFGVMGLLSVVLYIVTILKALSNIIKGYNVKYSVVAVGAMCYLLPSIGNPLLFAPQAVGLHCLALYLLRKEKNVNV